MSGDAQGHHPRRRLRHAAVSDHPSLSQAAAAGLRQADDLLPAVGADARRHPRDPVITTPRGPGRSSAGCSATAASGACASSTPRSRSPRGWRRPSSSAEDFLDGSPSRWCSATTSSSATTCRRLLKRAGERPEGGTVFGYQVADPERYGVVAFDARRAGCSRSRRSRRSRSRTARSPASTSRRQRARRAPAPSSPSPRGELEITDCQRPTSSDGAAQRRAHGPRLRLARHRHPRQPARGRRVRRAPSRSGRTSRSAAPRRSPSPRAGSTRRRCAALAGALPQDRVRPLPAPGRRRGLTPSGLAPAAPIGEGGRHVPAPLRPPARRLLHRHHRARRRRHPAGDRRRPRRVDPRCRPAGLRLRDQRRLRRTGADGARQPLPRASRR